LRWPAYEGFPFDKDGEEAKAIREVIEQADRERAASTTPTVHEIGDK
jgi:hypothetical protein